MMTTSQHGRAASAEKGQGEDPRQRVSLKSRLLALLSTSLLSCVGTMKMGDGSSANEWHLTQPSPNKALSGEAAHAGNEDAVEQGGLPVQGGSTEGSPDNSVRKTVARAPQYHLDRNACTLFVTLGRNATTLSVDFRPVLEDFKPLSVTSIGKDKALVLGVSEESGALRIYRLSLSAGEEPRVKLKPVYSGDSRATPTAAVSLSGGPTLFIDSADSVLYEYSIEGSTLKAVADYSGLPTAGSIRHVGIFTDRGDLEATDILLSSSPISPATKMDEIIILSRSGSSYRLKYPLQSNIAVVGL